MNGNILINYLESFVPLSEGLKQSLVERFKGPFIIKKGTILLQEGQVNDIAYFIIKGMARLYYNSKGQEVTSRFIPENSFAISYNSYFIQVPSCENLDLLQDSQVIAITRAKFYEIFDLYPEFNHVIRLLLEHALVLSDERGLMIRKLAAKDRYETLLCKYPEIFLKASTEHIASFLGISRETLSRIRSSCRV